MSLNAALTLFLDEYPKATKSALRANICSASADTRILALRIAKIHWRAPLNSEAYNV